ncbi:glycosyltransferase [Microbacterium sp. NPDC091382]|uniref:glycosyltransferase n=1 Tax=Microbacterium sp. NPDC091382 TaxID=3364210 RepID=UPI0038079377
MTGLLVHEWVEKSGGSELVVEEFLATFPEAHVQVLWDDAPGRFGEHVRETWLARTRLRNHKALALPLMPAVWRNLRSSGLYDWMLVSSHLFAHHAKVATQRDLKKLVYTHTPARYIWAPELDRRGASLVARAASIPLRKLDRRRADEAVAVAANSQFTADRVRAAWRREATVIYPPVDVAAIRAEVSWRSVLHGEDLRVVDSLPEEFLLGASRFVPYKRLDLVIKAGEASGSPVVIAGRGPEEGRLRELAANARVPVHIVVSPSDELLRALYQACRAFIFPAIEDFGIMPIEAMAAGAPVVVPAVGGAAEGARLTNGGVSFEDESHSSLKKAVEQSSLLDRHRFTDATEMFSVSRFRQEIASWVHLHTAPERK